MENISKTFSEALRTARGERSQAEFARILGIEHQATYHRYESGRIPDADVLYQMAMRLGMSMESLLLNKGEDESVMKEEGKEYRDRTDVLGLMTMEGLSKIGEDVIKQLSDAEPERKKQLLRLFREIGEELFRRESSAGAQKNLAAAKLAVDQGRKSGQ